MNFFGHLRGEKKIFVYNKMPTNTNVSRRSNIATNVLGNHRITNKEMIAVLANAIMYRKNRLNASRLKNNIRVSEARLNEAFAREFLRGIYRPIKLKGLQNKRNYLMLTSLNR